MTKNKDIAGMMAFFLVLLIAFPTIGLAVLNSILLGVLLGLGIAIAIIIIWFLSQQDNFSI